MEEKTSYGVLRIPLQNSKEQNKQIRETFSLYYGFYLEARKIVLKQLNELKSNNQYKHYKTKLRRWHQSDYTPTKKDKKFVNDKLKALTKAYHLGSNFDLMKFINDEIGAKYKAKGTNSQVRRIIVGNLYDGVDKILYHGAKKLGFTRFQNFSITTENTETPFKMEDRHFWLTRRSNRKGKGTSKIPNTIQYQLAPLTDYMQEVLHNRELRFYRIVQVPKDGHTDYCLQVIYKGLPPLKGRHLGHGGPVGLDIGPSSIAVSTDQKVALRVLYADFDKYQNQIKATQQKMSELDAINNPDAVFIGPNGKPSFIKGHRLQHTNRWYRLRQKLRRLYYLKSNNRKQAYETLANEFMSQSNQIKMEKLSIAGWQAGLFGKQIGNHAPGQLMEIIARKMNYFDEAPVVINTSKAKLSQFHHDTGEFIKANLDERTKIIDGFEVQRDLYSAFLASYVSEDGFTLSKEVAEHFNEFKTFQNEWVCEFTNNGQRELSSFGITPNMREQANIQ